MNDFLNDLLNAAKSGRNIEIEVVKAKPDLCKEIMRYTRLGKSGEGMADADYTFDFASMCWEKELHHISGIEQGAIPKYAAERFLHDIGFITELEQGFYHTETERTVPATEEERYTLGVDALRLTACEFVIAGLRYQFKWIAETDTADPYGKLYRALEVLRSDCGL